MNSKKLLEVWERRSYELKMGFKLERLLYKLVVPEISLKVKNQNETLNNSLYLRKKMEEEKVMIHLGKDVVRIKGTQDTEVSRRVMK